MEVPMYSSSSENYCSEASASMILKAFNHEVSQDAIHQQYWTVYEMIPLFEDYGLSIVDLSSFDIDKMREFIEEHDSPILLRYEHDGIGKGGHTVVITDIGDDTIYINDPDRGKVEMDISDMPKNGLAWGFITEKKSWYPGKVVDILRHRA